MEELSHIAWDGAFTAIQSATGMEDESVRLFPDSWHGRHFANEVQSFPAKNGSLQEAVQAVVGH